jgi:hypothetical protein
MVIFFVLFLEFNAYHLKLKKKEAINTDTNCELTPPTTLTATYGTQRIVLDSAYEACSRSSTMKNVTTINQQREDKVGYNWVGDG